MHEVEFYKNCCSKLRATLYLPSNIKQKMGQFVLFRFFKFQQLVVRVLNHTVGPAFQFHRNGKLYNN